MIIALSVGADHPTTTPETCVSKLDATHFVAALAGLLGLAGYVYVLGGLALYVELYRTGVPAGEAIDEFASRRYLVVGLPIALIVGLVSLALVLVVRRIGRNASASLDNLATTPVTRRLRKWFARPGARFLALLREHGPKQPAPVLLAIGAVLMALCMVAVAVVWPPINLRRALVTTHSGECVAGAYISTDANGVNLADGKAHRLATIPTAEVVTVVISEKLALSDQSIRVTRAPCA